MYLMHNPLARCNAGLPGAMRAHDGQRVDCRPSWQIRIGIGYCYKMTRITVTWSPFSENLAFEEPARLMGYSRLKNSSEW